MPQMAPMFWLVFFFFFLFVFFILCIFLSYSMNLGLLKEDLVVLEKKLVKFNQLW